MFDFLKSLSSRGSGTPEAQSVVDELARQNRHIYPFDLKQLNGGVKFLNAEPAAQTEIVMAMLAWFQRNIDPARPYQSRVDWQVYWRMRQAYAHMLKRKLPLGEQDLVGMLGWSARQAAVFYADVPQMIKVVTDYLGSNPLSPGLRAAIEQLLKTIEAGRASAQARRWVMRLKELLGETEIGLPLVSGESWAEAALQELRQLDPPAQTAWAELLLHCLRASGSTPSGKWLKEADRYLEPIGTAEFFPRLLAWFPLVDQPRTQQQHRYDNRETLLPVNADILKGLVWMCSRSDDPQMARALTALCVSAYRKIPGMGPRAAKVGNACFWALGNMPGSAGVAQLSILKVKVKTHTARRVIASSLQQAASRTGITAEEIEESSVPAYELQEVGLRREDFGEVYLELRVSGGDVEQVWIRKDGKRLSSPPKSVRETSSGELKELSQAIKDIRKMLAAQRERIDNLFLAQKTWTFPAWEEHYLNHPLVGTIARRLIWQFSRAGRSASAIWYAGQMVGRDAQPVDWLDAEATVELWHPIQADIDSVMEWRRWVVDHEIRQPFKQAHREVYLLTEAERSTRLYSNRYSAHILRQHQFNSLCAARGWKNALRLMVDAEFPPATRSLPQWGLRAEYWIEGIGDQYGIDTNDTGTFLYLTTDQVRFYRLEALENRAHAGGGGYLAARWNQTQQAEPVPLEEVPPLVFSEVMRDVDLFVGVASVGNDPNWLDGGPDVRYRDYWHDYSFGDLTESAKTRRQVLELLLPRLKIADRCKLADKFLIVRGDIRTYKIHLGSANILMEPNDQYLCIVPARGGQGTAQERLFVPFEGDQTLAIVLSKAFLLAEDKRIRDPSIVSQIKH